MHNPILQKLKITRLKLAIARVLYGVTRLFYRQPRYLVTRQGIRLELDLNEGIDLHLFLFGNFQRHVTDNAMIKLPEDGVVLDVGGNAGVLSLLFAQQVPRGQVHAFEPTDYAISKFRRNLELNPVLAQRISLTQAFVASVAEAQSSLRAFSSWPIHSSREKHAIHCGVDMTTPGIPSITLDEYCEEHGLQRVDLIKIDTDGHEMGVLLGAGKVLDRFAPAIIFEIGGYIMQERGIVMSDYFRFFNSHGYRLCTTTGKTVSEANYTRIIPAYGTVDLVALPAGIDGKGGQQ